MAIPTIPGQKATPNTPCPAYNGHALAVKKVRDFKAGNIRSYVHKLLGHEDNDYKLYQKMAYYLPVVSRTLEAYSGLIMTPEPIVSDAPDGLQPFLDDLTNDGEPFQRVAFRTVEEVCEAGRYFILVDYPSTDTATGPMSKLDAEKAGLRPFARCYSTESVIDWRTTLVNGRRVLSHVRLREAVEVDGENEWKTKTIDQVRVLDLHNGLYRVRLFRKATEGHSEKEEWAQFENDKFPRINGKELKAIPAVMFSPSSLDPSMLDLPPLHEMCAMSQSHLNDSALRQWALMWCGNPTLIISGLQSSDDERDEPLRFGSSKGIALGADGSADILSLGAEGVGALDKSMQDKRRDMAAIGARILADESGAQISTETARIQRAGEHSVLAGIANTVADGLTQILRMLAEWQKLDAPDLAVTLTTDFLPKGLQPGELTEWLKAVQDGNMPLEVAIDHLKSRGAVDPQVTAQDWQDQIDKEMADRPAPDDGEEEDDDDDDGDDEE